MATLVLVNESVKKSNASEVQPRKVICPESCLALQFNRYMAVNAKASLLPTGGFRTFNKIDTKKKSHCCPLRRARYEKGFWALLLEALMWKVAQQL